MKKEFYALLEENGKIVNVDKAVVTFNSNSIDIMDILEDDCTGYGNIFYSAKQAFDYLKANDALV